MRKVSSRIFWFSLLAFFSSVAFAGEITHTLLLFAEKFPLPAQKIDIGDKPTDPSNRKIIDFGHKAHKYPLKETRILQVPNTNYLMVEITERDQSEKDFVEEILNAGAGMEIQTNEFIEEYDSRIGGVVKRVETRRVGSLPDDLNKDWSRVVISSQ